MTARQRPQRFNDSLLFFFLLLTHELITFATHDNLFKKKLQKLIWWSWNLTFWIFVSGSTDLVHCTNEPNVSIPQLANLLIERSQNANWVVVYKALLTVHHLLAYGNEVRIRVQLHTALKEKNRPIYDNLRLIQIYWNAGAGTRDKINAHTWMGLKWCSRFHGISTYSWKKWHTHTNTPTYSAFEHIPMYRSEWKL